MDKPCRGFISELLEFQEDEKGPYLISERRIKKAQYMCVVWLSPDIYQFNNYIMVFKKEPKTLIQIAEWSDKAESSHISSILNRILDYYSPEGKGDIMLGIGRNAEGERFINYLRRSYDNRYYFYTEIHRDNISDVLKEEIGILCDDTNKLGLIEELKEASQKTVIHPFTGNHIDILKNIVVNRGKCLMPEKDEAFIMALAGAYRMFKDHPYRKPIDESVERAFVAEMKRPMFRFGS